MFSSPNVLMMYMMHMWGEKCFFCFFLFQCFAANVGRVQFRLRLFSAGRLSRHRKKKKGKIENDGPRGHFITQTGRPGDPQPPGTFPLGAPSVIKGSGVGRFIKTVYAAWGTQRSLSGLEMAAVFIAVYIKAVPVNTRAGLVWTHQPFHTAYAGSGGRHQIYFNYMASEC